MNRFTEHIRRDRVVRRRNCLDSKSSADWAAAGRLLDSFKRSVNQHPGEWLAAAFLLGTMAAWWIKRR
jgi:hypothetical protein